jgi:hypothetical protein
MICDSSVPDMDAWLCYKNCANEYYGVGPVCWWAANACGPMPDAASEQVASVGISPCPMRPGKVAALCRLQAQLPQRRLQLRHVLRPQRRFMRIVHGGDVSGDKHWGRRVGPLPVLDVSTLPAPSTVCFGVPQDCKTRYKDGYSQAAARTMPGVVVAAAGSGAQAPPQIRVAVAAAGASRPPQCTSPLGCYCSGLPDGNYPSPAAPGGASYVRCRNSTAESAQCPNGQRFDPARSACVQLVDDSPACAQDPSCFCKGRADGLHTVPSGILSYYCASGIGHPISCAKGSVWSAERRQCVLPPSASQAAAAQPCRAVSCFCVSKPPGLYVNVFAPLPDPALPLLDSYIRCANRTASVERCPSGQLYDDLSRSCFALPTQQQQKASQPALSKAP